MILTLGFSSCPNDTFIFDAMVHHRIDTEGLDFEVVMADVEALNLRAFAAELDVTKLSYHALGHLLNDYMLLPSGSALGNNCGPLLIAKRPLSATELNSAKIVVPGKYTTANFLFSLAYPDAKNVKSLIFSDIEQAVLSGEADAGVIIHESRFTFEEKGLTKIVDLGEFWETTTQLPIPLGGIVVRRNFPTDLQKRVARVMQRSVNFAFANPTISADYVRLHAQEMSDEVSRQHIGLYVNNFTSQLGEKGEAAVHHMFSKARTLGIIPDFSADFLVRENIER